jgi:Fe-S-cluster-containing dehydrogenase component
MTYQGITEYSKGSNVVEVDVALIVRRHRAMLAARTLQFAAICLDDDPLLLELAQRLLDTDWTTRPEQCPLCEEPDCPNWCPLYGNR